MQHDWILSKADALSKPRDADRSTEVLINGVKAKQNQKDSDMTGNVWVAAIFSKWQSEIIHDDPLRALPAWGLNLDDTCQAQIQENS